jgi:hypothetical protein
MGAPQSSEPSRFEKFLAPRALFLGTVLAFLGCCLLGRCLAQINHYRDFHRFHQAINPQSLYYPTASQVCSLARDHLDPERVAVVIGGNSIFYGHGQNQQQLWTRRLQELLGPRYRVLNLAVHGAQPNEFGGLAAEMLAKEYPKLILVTCTRVCGERDPRIDGDIYRYFFWDAFHKGLLPVDSDRDRRVGVLMEEQKDDTAFQDSCLRARIDSMTYANDLWTSVTYHLVNTVWTPQVSKNLLAPRCSYPDHADSAKPFGVRFAGRKGTQGLKSVTQVVRRCQASPLVGRCEAAINRQHRDRTCVVVCRECSFFLKQLPRNLLSKYERCVPEVVEGLRQAGFTALDVSKEFTDHDYADHCHFSPSGGNKLARQVADELRHLSQRLGYLNSGSPTR